MARNDALPLPVKVLLSAQRRLRAATEQLLDAFLACKQERTWEEALMCVGDGLVAVRGADRDVAEALEELQEPPPPKPKKSRRRRPPKA